MAMKLDHEDLNRLIEKISKSDIHYVFHRFVHKPSISLCVFDTQSHGLR